MKNPVLFCFLLMRFLPGFNQVNQYIPSDSIKNILAKRDSFTLVYHVKYYSEKNAVKPQDSFDLIYIKTGNNYIAQERNSVIICEESDCILLSENDQTIYYQKNNTTLSANSSLQIDPFLKNGIITFFEVENKKYYKLSSTESELGSIELYLSYDQLIPEKMVAVAPAQFGLVDGKQTIIFPKTVIEIEYYNSRDIKIVQPAQISEVIVFKDNIITLTPKYNAYELYEL